MKNYKKILFAGFFIVITVIFIYEGYKNYNIVLDFLYPFQNFISKTLSYVHDLKSSILENKKILEENKKLKEKINQQNLEIQKLKYLEYENAKLKQLLNYSHTLDIKNPQLAKVLTYSINSFEKYIIIDIGKKEGISTGDLVISNGYLVGIITKTGRFSSYVMLVDDPDFKITARTQMTREFVFYSGDIDGGKLDYVKKQQDIRVGDIVETDNPKAIPIGKIISVNDNPTEFFKKVKVLPFVKPLTLEYVLVIKGLK
jgi:rod shape-determining protein MreC